MALGGNSSWDKIQQGVKDTERLIVQREYNASMIKARQTLEFMVKNLADQAGIMDESDLKGMIDVLYENRWISKATCEHYHKIRMIGNKAAHEGDANAYSANQAYHMLSQEVYTFADDYRNVKKGRKPLTRPAVQGSSQNRAGGKPGEWRRSIPAESHGQQLQWKPRGRQLRWKPWQQLCGGQEPETRRQPEFLLFVIYSVKASGPGALYCAADPGGEACESRKAGQKRLKVRLRWRPWKSTEAAQEETESSGPVYRTTDVLNVRPEPSTSSERIGQLNAGVTVEYVRAHDDDWAVILYNGREAYVASQYLTTE